MNFLERAEGRVEPEKFRRRSSTTTCDACCGQSCVRVVDHPTQKGVADVEGNPWLRPRKLKSRVGAA